MCVCVFVFVNNTERECVCLRLCVRQRGRESVCLCMRQRESVCVLVCNFATEDKSYSCEKSYYNEKYALERSSFKTWTRSYKSF